VLLNSASTLNDPADLTRLPLFAGLLSDQLSQITGVLPRN
jgi:hypothetical protein